MHEDAIPGIDGGQAEDAHHQADEPVQHQNISARPQQAEVDDDMEEDEEVRCSNGYPHNAGVSAQFQCGTRSCSINESEQHRPVIGPHTRWCEKGCDF